MFIMCAVEMWHVFIMCCCRDVAGAVCLSCAAVEMWQVLCVYHVLL